MEEGKLIPAPQNDPFKVPVSEFLYEREGRNKILRGYISVISVI
jgi:hypothetical protein